ncbi:hypothetical protein FH972_021801 [Carpinus fangiana]|uniref:AB hydrolase-1 domain-containing protein n=1 Tax=Carpinus fangiana TaxID=176857 RepID=A0A5N6KQQ8_9ROSI|nr:hypothetical protein FH972_021801 [Carpinus fangiana]
MSETWHKFVTVQDDLKVFYRESGPADRPIVLLLHGFPSSSFQYRNFIPLLAKNYYVLAPDMPGFGLTVYPDSYQFTFAALAETMEAFLAKLSIDHCAVYIFDYGAPVAFRMALNGRVHWDAIITQNGNAYDEGFGEAHWAPVFQYWKTGSPEDREAVREKVLTLEATKNQHVAGVPAEEIELIAPESYVYDFALMQRPGNSDIQLDLFYDYRTNKDLYPSFQQYLRDSAVPVLAAWGKGDPSFVPAGAEAYRRDSPTAEIHLLDTGHFALETKLCEITALVLLFLSKKLS